jgi:type VI secretion system secreted protein Hcp
MGLFVKIDGIEGEATDSAHAKWILADSASLPVFRSIPGGAVDQQRTKGETSLGDITFTRQLDKSSPKLMEACALGKFNKEVLVEFTTTTGGKTETYLKWKLENVVFTGYSVHGNSTGEPLPSEQTSMNFTKITYTYTEFDNKTGSKKGNVETKYEMGANKS